MNAPSSLYPYSSVLFKAKTLTVAGIASSAIQNLNKFDPFADTGDDSTSGSGGVIPLTPNKPYIGCQY